ncbi:EamA family transporter, partial [Microbacteriaceae bacterium K1510]|nr:EamA family transporter [Microbacteriaceae bacterium K1510]
ILSVCVEQPWETAYTLRSLLSLFYLSVVASIIASTIYYWLVKETNATFPTTWTYVAPVIAMLIGALFLGEQLTLFG